MSSAAGSAGPRVDDTSGEDRCAASHRRESASTPGGRSGGGVSGAGIWRARPGAGEQPAGVESAQLEIVETMEQIKARAEAAVPGARLEIVRNGSPSEQHSLLVHNEHAVAVARFLREDPLLRLDYDSNVTGADWPDTVVQETTKT